MPNKTIDLHNVGGGSYAHGSVQSTMDSQRRTIEERDRRIAELRAVVMELVAAMHRYEMNVDDEPPFEHQAMMTRARQLLDRR